MEYDSCNLSPIGPNKDLIEFSIKKYLSTEKWYACYKALEICFTLTRNQGVHSVNALSAAGFKYTGVGDAARCDTCGLEVSGWTTDMVPFKIHLECKPDCAFVRSVKASNIVAVSSSTNSPLSNVARSTSGSSEQENPSKRQKTEESKNEPQPQPFHEVEVLKQVRHRTFSHWPHRTSPSKAQMIEAGFFNCNVGDRVICFYCNLICQQWTPHTDDPCEVHKTLRPQCPFVVAMLVVREAASILIVNENSNNNNRSPAVAAADQFRSNEIVLTAACNVAYIEIPRRHASFSTWPSDPLPSVDDLVRAGFFYTGTKTIVTCFYCNGSLQNWGPNDNPTIEHARWFPHCAYAKQLCGDDLYRKIQESKRVAQERARATESTTTNVTTNTPKLNIPDESTLSRFVAARLDLPISQRLLDRHFKLSIIKRCWEDQLRLKQDDFATDCDLFVACTILQKQIEHIDGKKENIIVPSVHMRRIREQEQAVLASPASVPIVPATASINASNTSAVQMTTASPVSTTESNTKIPVIGADKGIKVEDTIPTTAALEPMQTSTSTLANPCALCLSEEKRLACIPCGHLATCVPCGHSLRTCPICRREIEAFVRIYL